MLLSVDTNIEIIPKKVIVKISRKVFASIPFSLNRHLIAYMMLVALLRWP